MDFLIKKDKYKKFKYSPLQGEYLKSLDLKIDKDDLNTLYVFDGENILFKTQAWRTLAFELGGLWRILAIFSRVIPNFILNYIYDLVAKYRFRFFGKLNSCRVPSSEEQDIFIL